MKIFFNQFKTVLLISIIIVGFVPRSFSQVKGISAAIAAADKNSDYLAIRLLIKKMFREGISYDEWRNIRQVLQKRPQVGYDFIYKWDRVSIRDAVVDAHDKEINDMLDMGDMQMDLEKFEGAFTSYQKVAKMIKGEIVKGNKDNMLVYTSTLHSMARALYGAGSANPARFKDALEVYSWIDRKYPKYRKILFEKMWAGFRAGRMDIALGAIASQDSSFFSEFLEPEAYLVQIYVLKSLCREDEIKRARKSLQNFKKRLEGGKDAYTYADWAQSDIETLSLLRLAKAPIKEETYNGLVTVSMKKEEQAMILGALDKRFQAEKRRVLSYVEKAIAYSFLALNADRRMFAQEKVPDREVLARQGKEIWPVQDGEDWLDEMGGHIYIGENLCQRKK